MSFKVVDYGYKVENPDGIVAEGGIGHDSRDGRNISRDIGKKSGVSGSATFLKAEGTLDAEKDISGAVSGPTIGGSAGLSIATDTGAGAMLEASAVKAEGTIGVTKKASLYGSVGLNADTGVKANREGVKANLLGWGLTLGVGGKFTFDTPFGSLGAAQAQTLTNEQKIEQPKRKEKEDRLQNN
ncbi:hypothetical protein Bhyg_00711, partial [Pseudolycoriella hygida]